MLDTPRRNSPLLDNARPPLGQPWPDRDVCETWHDAMADYLQQQEPHVRALVEAKDVGNWPRAIGPECGHLPQLAGLTVGVKDIFHARGYTTRAGTRLPARLFQGQEASVVSRLGMAGAHAVGKTVTTEFAYFEPGPTTNPWHPEYTPGGSSSGSAAGVAAGLFDVGLGTQTVGSVIRPAAFCGIPGYKPSMGRIARDGVLLFSDTVDHVGLLTRDWPTMLAAAAEVVHAWRPHSAGPQRPVFGLIQDEYVDRAEPAMIEHVRNWGQRLEHAGFRVKTVEVFHEYAALAARHQNLTAYELHFRHREWFAQFEDLYRPRTAELIRKGQQMSQHRWQECRRSCQELRAQIESRMREAQVDILISPAAVGTAPHGLGYTGDPIMNLPWTHAGLPVTTMPMGLAEDSRGTMMPAGVQLAAGMGEDEMLLHVSRQVCQALPPLDRL